MTSIFAERVCHPERNEVESKDLGSAAGQTLEGLFFCHAKILRLRADALRSG